jgi:F-type H+-transporting ATPase subunit a
LKLFVPEAPLFVLFLLLPIEMASYTIRALSLALRLSANIMAGHILVYIISSFVLYIGSIKFLFYVTSVILFAILVLELGVAFVQAYVFTVLFCIYLNDSLKNPGH